MTSGSIQSESRVRLRWRPLAAVVATALVFLTALIFGLDSAFSWLVLKIFNVQ
jgi:hypothetical protein